MNLEDNDYRESVRRIKSLYFPSWKQYIYKENKEELKMRND